MRGSAEFMERQQIGPDRIETVLALMRNRGSLSST